MSKLDEIAELLLRALAMPEPIAPDVVGFVYRRRGGEQKGAEVLVQGDTRESAYERRQLPVSTTAPSRRRSKRAR